MAIVAHTPYTGNGACSRTNEYICDGHGLEISRVNRYITDGHGRTDLLGAYNCPADPYLATEYMKILRHNYELQHTARDYKAAKSVTHMQLYISPTEEDNVPPEERMEMMRELIERTVLRNFASIYVPHDNRPDKHGHISLCPYSIPDETGRTHKLCMNNALLNSLRREMDYLCTEHGYSIVENPELWGDASYRKWFFQIKEQGIVKIHPPREQDRTTFKKDRNRARSYAARKRSQALQQEQQREFYKKMTRSYSEDTADYFYAPAYLYDPNNPEHAIRIRKRGKDGVELSELEQRAVALFSWAYQALYVLKKRNVSGSSNLKKRLQGLVNKTFAAKDFLHALDIRTHAELIAHIKECGSDIAELKQDITRQNTILDHMKEVIEAIDRWENQCDSDAQNWLKEQRCDNAEEQTAAKKRYARAIARKAANEALLEDRKTEYRHLKETEALLHPVSSQKEWHEYLYAVFGKEAEKKIGFMDESTLRRQLHQMGKIVGFFPEDVDRLLAATKKAAGRTTRIEYRSFIQVIYTISEENEISSVYEEIRQCYKELRELRGLVDDLTPIGPFTFLLMLVLAFYVGMEEAAKEQEIEVLKWEAAIMKEYAKETRRTQRHVQQKELFFYAKETVVASEKEIAAAHARFHEQAAEIVRRLDGCDAEVEGAQKTTAGLDQLIENAASRTLVSGTSCFSQRDGMDIE